MPSFGAYFSTDKVATRQRLPSCPHQGISLRIFPNPLLNRHWFTVHFLLTIRCYMIRLLSLSFGEFVPRLAPPLRWGLFCVSQAGSRTVFRYMRFAIVRRCHSPGHKSRYRLSIPSTTPFRLDDGHPLWQERGRMGSLGEDFSTWMPPSSPNPSCSRRLINFAKQASV